ncbi:type II CAAX prenyl endopeptidase Rce1 family protein [Neobacillus niacini]|uniref:CPBP family glutamic-type intramembrane protease n=1 Tax=Neobacillus niacini TaxID=86668 RepID=UPI00285B0E72|nr:CPBP family glutamic-type intramembrane protease [Neobacillus niacini]MDR6998856.1 membrane protease YdiL (CAAX protease family) [Neobacillus niacini]
MMTTNLTEPLSKKMLAAILFITFGAEIVLYFMRYSYLAGTLYDAIMVSSFFIGWKLNRRLADEGCGRLTKRQRTLQFTGAFLVFFIGSTIINIYSNIVFPAFNKNYDQYVQVYTDPQTATAGASSALFSAIDSVGSDLYNDLLAGLEEVWRLGYIVLFLFICKKIFPRRWENGSRDLFILSALFFTSILFGIDHTLDTVQTWPVRIGAIVTFANMGLLLGLILLWTRSLWVTVIVHSVYDITTTFSWNYFHYAVETFALSAFILHIILLKFEKTQQQQSIELTD